MNNGKKKIKIELEDDEGDKYNLSIEGNFSKEKIMKVFDLVNFFNNKSEKISENGYSGDNEDLTLSSKIWKIIEQKLLNEEFTSNDVFKNYCHVYENIQFSVISTYLSRFYLKNKLSRTKHGKEWMYSVKSNLSDKKFVNEFQHLSTVYDLHQ